MLQKPGNGMDMQKSKITINGSIIESVSGGGHFGGWNVYKL